ncbi:PREDICTED: glutaredoxin-1-like [Galeopterus variegatus]|uniref:Glutaredoxin-1 n=1 Tax=Galeopterus variegatus TaxID=482537 RepID=A0ABM0RJP9_GALVR|nr:PREDICTED: glutaredoxin-1-like [Galeopterus variegatus]
MPETRKYQYTVQILGSGRNPVMVVTTFRPFPIYRNKLRPVSLAHEFVNSKIQPGKVVVFIKPTCPYCKKTQEILSQLPFKQGVLEFVDITATDDVNEIQDYLQQLTGARTVPRVFIGKNCIGGCSDLITMQQSGELVTRLKQIGALQ